jgi:hypothetical protein
MQIDGAIIKEQGVTFAIVVVQQQVLASPEAVNSARKAFNPIFQGLPIILMAQNAKAIPSYQGRQDIVQFLANIHPSRIRWKRYHIS